MIYLVNSKCCHTNNPDHLCRKCRAAHDQAMRVLRGQAPTANTQANPTQPVTITQQDIQDMRAFLSNCYHPPLTGDSPSAVPTVNADSLLDIPQTDYKLDGKLPSLRERLLASRPEDDTQERWEQWVDSILREFAAIKGADPNNPASAKPTGNAAGGGLGIPVVNNQTGEVEYV